MEEGHDGAILFFPSLSVPSKGGIPLIVMDTRMWGSPRPPVTRGEIEVVSGVMMSWGVDQFDAIRGDRGGVCRSNQNTENIKEPRDLFC